MDIGWIMWIDLYDLYQSCKESDVLFQEVELIFVKMNVGWNESCYLD